MAGRNCDKVLKLSLNSLFKGKINNILLQFSMKEILASAIQGLTGRGYVCHPKYLVFISRGVQRAIDKGSIECGSGGK